MDSKATLLSLLATKFVVLRSYDSTNDGTDSSSFSVVHVVQDAQTRHRLDISGYGSRDRRGTNPKGHVT